MAVPFASAVLNGGVAFIAVVPLILLVEKELGRFSTPSPQEPSLRTAGNVRTPVGDQIVGGFISVYVPAA